MARTNQEFARKSYEISQALKRNRTHVILGAFCLCTAMLGMLGYFSDLSRTDAWAFSLGFIWLTAPASIAIYLIPRLAFLAFASLSGYEPKP